MNAEKITWGGWQNCYRLSGAFELIVTADVGPRIISMSFSGESNQFFVADADLGLTGGDNWRIYGGHRLWHAPEIPQRTYLPDNAPVDVQTDNESITFTMSEAATGIEKSIKIVMHSDHTHVHHTMTNNGLWSVELSIWALSAMKVGGTGILPLPPRGPHHLNLLPNTPLVFWAYTNLTDPRWTLGHEFILLRQDPTQAGPQKIGAPVPAGWIAYLNEGTLFVKRFTPDPQAVYPDMGCQIEMFTNEGMFELETLSPLYRLNPGESRTHTEIWSLHRDIPAVTGDDDVKRHILPLIKG